MLVTFTNPGSSPVLVQSLYTTIAAGLSITTRRSWCDLDSELPLKQQVQAGEITLSFTMEAGDSANLGIGPGTPSYDNTTRPLPSTVPPFTVIYNTADNAPNWSDGVNWRDSQGNIT